MEEFNLVKTINRYFHDEESACFHDRHDVRIGIESYFYREFFNSFFKAGSGSKRMLDVGTGTGLVGLTLSDEDVQLVCSDISGQMLLCAKRSMGSVSKGSRHFTACDSEKLPFKTQVFDLITCNAAMHHFPSVESFARELERVLVPGGTIIIGFEANRKFWKNGLLLFFYKLASKLSPRRAGKGAIPYGKICHRVNERLLREGLIEESLSDAAILEKVDAHSPNAGEKIDISKGFDIEYLLRKVFASFEHKVVYHYDGLPGPLAAVNRRFFSDSAPRFSLILTKKVI